MKWPWNARGNIEERISTVEERLLALEERDMEQRLLVLDSAERVAHKLMDRKRKRLEKESNGHDEDQPMLDQGTLLREARARYGR